MSETRTVPITALDRRFKHLRLRCGEAELSRLRQRLSDDGQRQPLLVSGGIDGDALVVLDGFTRLELLEQGGAAEVLVVIVDLDATASLAAMVTQAHAGPRRMSELEEGWIIRSLHREHGMDQVEIGRRLSRHKSWVCRRLQLVERLELGVQEDVRLGLVSASAARELARLPRGNQGAASEAMARHALGSRQAALLVRALIGKSLAERRAILADPLAHLPARRQPVQREGRLRRALLALRRAVTAAGAAWRDRPPAQLPGEERRALRELSPSVTVAAREALELTAQLAEEVALDAS